MSRPADRPRGASGQESFSFVRGGEVDVPDILELFDANVAWLAASGRSGQWGDVPWSRVPRRVELVHDLVRSGDVTLGRLDGRTVGVSIVSSTPMPYVEPLDEPERYLRLLMTDPSVRGRGVGGRLIELARRNTVDQGIGVLRVDCWDGGDRRLMQYYESQGFLSSHRVQVSEAASVQVLEWRQRHPRD